MRKKEVLKKLDELVPQIMDEFKWTKIEATAAVVQKYRNFRHVAKLQELHESNVKRRCEKFILSYEK